MSETMTTAEACAVLQVDQEQATLLMAGPFAPDAGELTVRQVLGCELIYALPMLHGPDAVAIALTAATEARADRTRILAVGWRNCTPFGCWLVGDMLAADLGMPLLALPVDRMLAALHTRLEDHRAMTARPN